MTDELAAANLRAEGVPEDKIRFVGNVMIDTLDANVDQARALDVNEIVRDWCGSLTRDEVLERCGAHGAPAGPLNNIADIFADRQFHARRNLTAVDYEAAGDVIMVPSVLPRMSETPGRIESLGPRLGEHTDEVLGSLLDLSADELQDLRARRVI